MTVQAGWSLYLLNAGGRPKREGDGTDLQRQEVEEDQKNYLSAAAKMGSDFGEAAPL
jgi:hypothetical protein